MQFVEMQFYINVSLIYDLNLLCNFNLNHSKLNDYRKDAAKRQTAGIKFTHRPKIRVFAQQGRLVTPIHVKLGKADGHLGSLGCSKSHLNRRRGWECDPKNKKKFHFLVKSRLVGANPLTNF